MASILTFQIVNKPKLNFLDLEKILDAGLTKTAMWIDDEGLFIETAVDTDDLVYATEYTLMTLKSIGYEGKLITCY